MPAMVALVAARPETLEEDYRRAAVMAGLQASLPKSLTALGNEPEPGFSSPVWQAPLAARAVGLDPDLRPTQRVPAIGVPSREAGARPSVTGTLLLPVPVLTVGWGVALAVPTWLSALGMSLSDPRGHEEDICRLLAEVDKPLGCLADGVLWGARPGSWGRTFIQRGILLAGRDPVAVDAVALELAGLDPISFTWIQALRAAGVGEADPAQISIAGDDGLLDAPFEAAPWTGAAGKWASPAGRWSGMLWRLLRKRGLKRSFSHSPWGGLAATFR